MFASPDAKVAFIGDATVGKSSLVERIARGRFSDQQPCTIGAAFVSLKREGRVVHIWDTAGQERFNSLVPMYLSGASVVVIVFDVTNEESHASVYSDWLPRARQARRYGTAAPPHVVIVANKFDLMPAYALQQARARAARDNVRVLVTSAKTGAGVDDLEVFILEAAREPKDVAGGEDVVRMCTSPSGPPSDRCCSLW